ncbi:hypothetical protein BGX38DRAFT_172308 [Terfezia claveryi]|nr:hypothetical protein BGX38DRAFT_172308 [Terfezia claveryi]
MATASEAWFKIINPESKWDLVTLEGIKYVAQLKKAIKKEIAPELDAYSIVNITIKAKQKNDDDNNAVEVDARRTLASIFESFGNDTEFLVSVPVPHSKSEQVRYVSTQPLSYPVDSDEGPDTSLLVSKRTAFNAFPEGFEPQGTPATGKQHLLCF